MRMVNRVWKIAGDKIRRRGNNSNRNVNEAKLLSNSSLFQKRFAAKANKLNRLTKWCNITGTDF